MNEQRDRLDLVIKQVFERMKNLSPKPDMCPDEELLAAYLAGDLTQEEMERIEEHLVLCGGCTDNLISFSDVERSYPSAKETFTTKEMVNRAKDLVKPPRDTIGLWERVSSWFTVFRPVPVMVATSVILAVVVFSLYNLYTPSGLSPSIKFGIIAKMSPEMLTRETTQDYKEVEVQDGGVLHSGDQIKIKFELQEEAYIYLLSLDSLGNLTRLFPAKDTGLPIKFKPNETYFFPAKEIWLRLDDNIGHEALYLIASSEVIGNIDLKIDQLKEEGIDKIANVFPGVKIQSFNFKHE